ncbi:hypothetical protein EU99_1108 [Prochlorococcus marinus str. MIT 9321]|uniref:Uncharacterized protein n=1 Tax=Prochlorococcus marinus str. MIT 9401 TaxID=167551 RepID=A0A0A2AZS0_PROMR|nr:hypothetical protein EU99_1108 [Prochlorococcus marinus str. MIT 9321]KGG04664.1 hypothetical protein EV00_1696 [Prochlorococcus marinus str. MIT 9322]KGG07348.1 hypothetical protein EV01_1685 [Prochlorococcus marinus str. MIT 9401]
MKKYLYSVEKKYSMISKTYSPKSKLINKIFQIKKALYRAFNVKD